jgi:small membrane protein
MKLMPSQIIIVATVLAFLLYAVRLRTVLRDRLMFAGIVAVGVVLTFRPDLATHVANLVGIGRGTDLLLYIFLLFSLFQTVYLADRLKTIDARLTSVVREQALESAVAQRESDE